MTDPAMSRAVQVTAPPSKSLSHRAVICAALAGGGSLLSGVLDSVDLDRTMDCLGGCGAGFDKTPDGLAVTGVAGRPRGGTRENPARLMVHESGTTARLMTGVAAAGHGVFAMSGAPRMHQRPVAPMAEALAGQGPEFVWRELPGCPPYELAACGLAGGTVAVDAGLSSQFLSGLLLAAPMARSAMTVELAGDKVVSWPYVALTLSVMQDFGIRFEVQERYGANWVPANWREPLDAVPGRLRFRVFPGAYRSGEHRVEGDWSNASYFLAAGALGPNPVTVRGLREDSLQGDRAILDILKSMGARMDVGGNVVTVHPSRLKGVNVDMGHCPDLVPTVAVLAAGAEGETVITGAAHLRLKECDRIQAPVDALAKAGCLTEALHDGMRIFPGPLAVGQSLELSSHNDHRMAMSLSLLEFLGIGVVLDNPDCVQKSFPGFWDEMKPVREAAKLAASRAAK